MHVKLSEVQGMGTLQRAYKWNLSFQRLPTEVTNAVPDAARQLNIRCMSSSVPKPRIETVSANPHGIDLVEPGIVHLNDTITFQIVETVDIKSYKIIRALWQIDMQDEGKAQSDMTGSRDKSFDVQLERLDNYNNPNLIYTCKKCFLSAFDDPGFVSNSDSMKMSFTITYNWFTVANASSVVSTVAGNLAAITS